MAILDARFKFIKAEFRCILRVRVFKIGTLVDGFETAGEITMTTFHALLRIHASL